MEMNKEHIRRKLFYFVFFVSIIIGIFAAGIDAILIKKIVWILLVLIVFAFSNTVHGILEQVREELKK